MDYVNVRDFEYLTNFWKEKIQPTITDDTIAEEVEAVGKNLKDYLNLEIADLDAEASICLLYTSPSPRDS